MNFALKCVCVVVSITVIAFVLLVFYVAMHKTSAVTPPPAPDPVLSKHEHCLAGQDHFRIMSDNDPKLMAATTHLCQGFQGE